jgi:hypothetical protein
MLFFTLQLGIFFPELLHLLTHCNYLPALIMPHLLIYLPLTLQPSYLLLKDLLPLNNLVFFLCGRFHFRHFSFEF